MRSFDLKLVSSTALIAVFAFAAAGDANAQRHRGKNNNADRGNRAKAVKMQRSNGGSNRTDRSAARMRRSEPQARSASQVRNARQNRVQPQSRNTPVRAAQRTDNNRWNRRPQRDARIQAQPQRVNRTVRQPQQRNDRGRWDNARRNDNARRDRERREIQIRRGRPVEHRSNDRYRRPQIIVPAQAQKRYPQRYRTERRGNSWENKAWRDNRNRERRENYYAPLRDRNRNNWSNRRDRYERRSRRPAVWNPARTGRSWGMHNRNRNILASYYRHEQHNRRKAYKRAQKQRERYWREVRNNERRYQRRLARMYRDRYYSQPYYYQPYTTVRYGYAAPRWVYYPRTYTVYNSYPSGYYYDDDRYDPYYQQSSYYDPYYYDDDDSIDWTSVILQTALSAFLPDSGFDSIIPVNNYAYEPGYDYAPVDYYGGGQPYYAAYSPTVYPTSMIENAYQRGYQEGFQAGQNSAYYNDPYVMQNGSYYPYSMSLSRQRELLSDGYERGYMDAMNGNGGYYYDDGYAGGGDLVGILLDNVLTLG